jgi:hypothetical protein
VAIIHLEVLSQLNVLSVSAFFEALCQELRFDYDGDAIGGTLPPNTIA